MVLNPTVTFRFFFTSSKKSTPMGGTPPPPDPNPKAKVTKKTLGQRGSKNRKSVAQRLQNGQEMRNDLAITLSWGTVFTFGPLKRDKSKQ